MKKTIQIHIGGRHFMMDEDAYLKLNHYLESLRAHFSADGDTGKEIVEDIELRIAELLDSKVTNGKQAINLADVNEVIAILGKVEEFVYEGDQEERHQEYEYSDRRENRRLFRDPDNYILGGVASGLGQYFDIDPVWIRLAFVALVILKGAGLFIYLILWLVVPKARTTTEKLQMRGKPVNLSTIKDSVNREYEKVKAGFDGVSHSQAADRTRNALENLMRAIGLVIVAVFKFIVGAVGIVFLVIGSIFLAGFIMFLMGFTSIFGHIYLWPGVHLPEITSFFVHSGHYYIAMIALAILILIPIAALIYGGTKILFNIQSRHPILRAFLLTAWILALILFITLIIVNVPDSAIEATGKQTVLIEAPDQSRMHIQVQDNTANKRLTHYRVFGLRFDHSDWDDALYNQVTLSIRPSEDENMHLSVEKRIKNVSVSNSWKYFDRVDYYWYQQDSVLFLDQYFTTDEDDFWMFADIDLQLEIPEGREIVITQEVCDILESSLKSRYCYEQSLAGKTCRMSPEGTLVPVN